MIVIDFSQICIAGYMQIAKHSIDKSVDVEAFRHVALNSIRAINMKFRNFTDYSRLVIAVDAPKSWRKQIFPFYKANRKKDKDASPVDWAQLFQCIKTVEQELIEYFPYQVIQIRGAEADDVIGSLARYNNEQNRYMMIVSGDKDFIQLQRTNLIRQYDNVHDHTIEHSNPQRYLFEHVMKGDRGDGIPNVLSPDNAFVVGIRQKPMRQTKLDLWWENGIEKDVVNPEYLKRNRRLIDLSCTPAPIYDQVVQQVDQFDTTKKCDIYAYLVRHQLRNLAGHLGDFR